MKLKNFLILVALICVATLVIENQGKLSLKGSNIGQALASTNTSDEIILGKPLLSPDFINRVLASYTSPASGKGQALYDLGQKYGINSDVALAFFCHESTCGTTGEAVKTHSLGNLRCIPNFACVDQDRGGYALFPSWEAGFQAWYELMKNLYITTWNLTTLPQIIHKYAPAADHNDEAGYVRELTIFLSAWWSGRVQP